MIIHGIERFTDDGEMASGSSGVLGRQRARSELVEIAGPTALGVTVGY